MVILSLIVSVIATIVCIYVTFSSIKINKSIKKKRTELSLKIKINTLKAKYERLLMQDRLGDYPYIDNNVSRMLNLSEAGDVYNEIKFKRVSLLKPKNIKSLLEIYDELDTLNDEEVKSMYSYYNEIKSELLEAKCPIRYKLNPYLATTELTVLKVVLIVVSNVLKITYCTLLLLSDIIPLKSNINTKKKEAIAEIKELDLKSEEIEKDPLSLYSEMDLNECMA